MSSCLSSSEEELTGNKNTSAVSMKQNAKPNEKLFENWTEKNKLELWTSKESTQRYLFKFYNHFNPSAETISTLSQSNDIISWLKLPSWQGLPDTLLPPHLCWLARLPFGERRAPNQHGVQTLLAGEWDRWALSGRAWMIIGRRDLPTVGPSTANQWDPFSNPRLRHL